MTLGPGPPATGSCMLAFLRFASAGTPGTPACRVAGRNGALLAYPLGPETVNSTLWDSFLPSPVQTAPCASQSVVTGSTMVKSALPDGCTVTSHRTFFPCSRRLACTTSPPVTVKAWSRSVT